MKTPVVITQIILLGSLLLGLPGHYSSGFLAAAQALGLTRVRPSYVEQLPVLPDWGGPEATKLAIEEGIVWPLGVPTPTSRVVIRFTIEPTGALDSLAIVQGVTAEADAAVLASARRLPAFIPARQGGRPVRVAYTLGIALPSPPTGQALARRLEARTLEQGTAHREPGEADSTFVRRVLPASYSDNRQNLLAYAWRPSAFGRQLFFWRRGEEDNDGGMNLFVLDPYQADTYAVQRLTIDSMGDLTDLAALFFADANRDGRKDLLVLNSCSLRERVRQDGQWLSVHETHYRTDIWYYTDPDKAGQPQYRQADYCADLDDLARAAEVRQALARPPKPHRPSPTRAVAKPAKATK